MSIQQYKDRGPDKAFWIGVLARDLFLVRVRLEASRLEWVRRPGVLRHFLVRLPKSRSGAFDPELGRKVLAAVRDGQGAVVEKPADFLASIGQGVGNRQDCFYTRPGTDARSAEVALQDMPEGPVRELVRQYLAALSEVQADFRICGDGKRSLEFVEHFWGLGDQGVAERFRRIAPRLVANRREDKLRAPARLGA